MSKKSEPLVYRGLVTATVAAVLSGLIAFGVDISADQKAALLGIVASVSALVVAVWSRGEVTPVDSLPEEVNNLEEPGA